MKTWRTTRVLEALVWLVGSLVAVRAPGAVVGYPAVPSLVTSDLYAVRVDGVPVWTEKVRTDFDLPSLPDWFLGSPYVAEQQELHIANLAGEGRLRVRIKVARPVKHVAVRPASRGIEPVVRDGSIEFTATGPDCFYVTSDDLPPLLVFVNPPETEVPAPDTPGLRYFGPGEHHPGLMELHDDESVYLAPGAIVHGGIRATGASRIRVFGRGILEGDAERRLVHIWNSHDVRFEGVILRNGDGWTNTLENCEGVTYRGVKVISFGPGGDGIDPLNSRHVTIERCFFRCTDDCIAIKAPDPGPVSEHIRVTGCTMVGFAYSDGVTIGFETNNPEIADVEVRDCDILQARGGSRVNGHAAFSIICDGPARIHDIHYEDIRVEADVRKLFELHVTDGTLYDVNPPGHIADVTLRNITWASRRPIILRGFDADHRVEGVTFEHCTVAGTPLEECEAEVVAANAFVQGVRTGARQDSP